MTLWTVARQAPLSTGFSRQEYWNELPCLPPGDLPDPGIKFLFPVAAALQVDSLPLSPWGSPDPFHIRLERQLPVGVGQLFCVLFLPLQKNLSPASLGRLLRLAEKETAQTSSTHTVLLPKTRSAGSGPIKTPGTPGKTSIKGQPCLLFTKKKKK